MSEVIQEGKKRAILTRLRIQNRENTLRVLAYSIIGASIYLIIALIPMPFTMISLFKFGLAPAFAVIAVAGSIRGPIAGLLTGYIGEVVHGLLLSGTVITTTLPALAYGVLGFVVGLTSYDFGRGRSLAKLSLLAAVGFLITAVLVLLIGLFVESIGLLAAIGFVFLPLITVGLPSVALLSPVYGGLWHLFDIAVRPRP